MIENSFDIAVVGANIVGLAHALATSRLGLRVVVLDRDEQANGVSIRNFGFVTVNGREAGTVWRRTRRSRDVWAEVAGPAGIAIEQTGLTMAALRRPWRRTGLIASSDQGRGSVFAGSRLAAFARRARTSNFHSVRY